MNEIGTCHIVIGGGTSGIFVCKKLLERDNVILIERGPLNPENFCPDLTSPSKWFNISHKSKQNTTMHTSRQQKHLSDRVISYPQGKGLGGSSNINAMLFSSGHSEIFDKHWPIPWKYSYIDDLLETVRLDIVPTISRNHCQSFSSADEDASSTEDEDVCEYTINKDNRRILLGSLLHRDDPKLTIIHQSEVIQVIIQHEKAIGVVVRSLVTDSIDRLFCRGHGEVVICAGVFQSPRILTSSITDHPEGAVSTKTLIEKIGENLQDHIHIPLMMFNPFKKKNGSDNGVDGWIYLDEHGDIVRDFNDKRIPYIQLLHVDGSLLIDTVPELFLPRFASYTIYVSGIRPILRHCLQLIMSLRVVRWLCSCIHGFLICNVHPSSRGRVSVDGIIDPSYLSDQRDRDMLKLGFHRARGILKKRSFAVEVFPGPLLALISFNTYVKLFSQTYYHACGTCSMASHPSQGVVDPLLRVHGVKSLRVADASVIPSIPSGPIAAVCMAIGLAAGELILSSGS